MKFSEIVEQASGLLQRKGKVTYGALKREFDLDDEALNDLKEELLFAAYEFVSARVEACHITTADENPIVKSIFRRKTICIKAKVVVHKIPRHRQSIILTHRQVIGKT